MKTRTATTALLGLLISGLVAGCDSEPQPRPDNGPIEADHGIVAQTCETNEECDGGMVCVPSGDYVGLAYCAFLCEGDDECRGGLECVIVENPMTHTGESLVCGEE